jgi:hypothetical protein
VVLMSLISEILHITVRGARHAGPRCPVAQ